MILEVQEYTKDMRAVTQVKVPTVQRLAFLMLFSRTSRNQAKKGTAADITVQIRDT